MTEPDTMPADVHPEVALLPWYVNGTLGGTERQQVDRHLQSCALCRRELDELTSMKRLLTATYEAQSAPSARLVRSVMAQVAADARAAGDGASQPSSWLDGMDQRFRSLFLPRWVPTLAVVLLIAQMGLLLWVQLPQTESEQVSTRSLGMQTEAITVTFQPLATEEQIRGLLRQVSGRITEGPTAEGLYTIEVPSTGASTTHTKADLLRARSDIVRSAEPVKR
jgi:anti-sigma factor RsiW